ncbi:hypothetical protein ACTID9_23805 [Brevibacillus fluminis]
MLPQELLPGDWKGKKILQEFAGCMETLANAIPQDTFYSKFTR